MSATKVKGPINKRLSHPRFMSVAEANLYRTRPLIWDSLDPKTVASNPATNRFVFNIFNVFHVVPAHNKAVRFWNQLGKQVKHPHGKKVMPTTDVAKRRRYQNAISSLTIVLTSERTFIYASYHKEVNKIYVCRN